MNYLDEIFGTHDIEEIWNMDPKFNDEIKAEICSITHGKWMQQYMRQQCGLIVTAFGPEVIKDINCGGGSCITQYMRIIADMRGININIRWEGKELYYHWDRIACDNSFKLRMFDINILEIDYSMERFGDDF